MNIALATCSGDDKEFVFRVTEEAMRAYVEEAFGSWDADEQRRRLYELFDTSAYSLVVVDGVRAGILAVENQLKRTPGGVKGDSYGCPRSTRTSQPRAVSEAGKGTS
jgi:hypothetical protein